MVRELTKKMEMEVAAARVKKGKGKRLPFAIAEAIGTKKEDLSYHPPNHSSRFFT